MKYKMAALDAIKSERGLDELCWWHLIEKWLLSNGSLSYPATWEGLYKLLQDSEVPAATLTLFKKAVNQAIQPDHPLSDGNGKDDGK